MDSELGAKTVQIMCESRLKNCEKIYKHILTCQNDH